MDLFRLRAVFGSGYVAVGGMHQGGQRQALLLPDRLVQRAGERDLWQYARLALPARPAVRD